MKLVVFFSHQGGAVQTQIFTQSNVSIGSASTCDLSFVNSELADEQGSLMWNEGELFIERASHLQMIQVNDRVIDTPVVLSEQDVVQMGSLLISAQAIHPSDDLPAVPKTLSDKVMEQDLVLRMGGAKPPSSLNSIHNALDLDTKKTETKGGPSSLNSIYNAFVDDDEGQNEVLPTQSNQVKTQPVQVGEPPLPSKAQLVSGHSPASLNSIYESLTPLPDEFLAAPLESKETGETTGTETYLPHELKAVLPKSLSRLLERSFIDEVHLIGAHHLSCKLRGVLQVLSDEIPFNSREEAQQAIQHILNLLDLHDSSSGAGRLGSYWIYANLHLQGEPQLCFQRLKPLASVGVINSELLPQLGKFIEHGARFAIISPRGQEHVSASVVKVLMQHYCREKRFASIGVKHDLGQEATWLELGQTEQALYQASALMLEGVVIADQPTWKGETIFELAANTSTSFILLSGKNPEAGFHKIRSRSVNKYQAGQAVNMLIFAKEIEGKPQLVSIYSYATGEKVYGR